ncbi:MAG: hypothetical protein KDA45_07965 [Planctomycetales bacterium]|nr:hypothetical protein [Planctomycetales bacterium]
MEAVNSGGGNGTVQDPSFTLADTTRNLMWGGGAGPTGYDNNLGLLGNFHLTSEQINAAIYNGLRLDPDGNGIGVLRIVAIPEPATASWALLGVLLLPFHRRYRRTG